MKIAGFEVKKKFLVIAGCIVGLIVISSISSSRKEAAERQKALEEAERLRQQHMSQSTDTEVLSYDDRIQANLVSQYGEPPEGFKWGYNRTLIPLSNDSMTAEEVMYAFIRSLSILDFSTAQKFSTNSRVIENFRSSYKTYGIVDYYDDFLRKQYRESLTSLEIEGVESTAVFAEGTMYFTVKVNALDLSDKDFWEDDRQTLFEMMRLYDDTESDDVKKETYVYNYVAEKYSDGSIGKKSYTIDLIVEKGNQSGWLVSGDASLDAVLSYKGGVDVVKYIFSEYRTWLQEERQKERLQRN